MAKGELPPPVYTPLAYASDGWAIQCGQLNPSGKPKPPPSAVCRSVAIALLREPDGVDRLSSLVLSRCFWPLRKVEQCPWSPSLLL